MKIKREHKPREERVTECWHVLGRVGGLVGVSHVCRIMGMSRGSNAYVQSMLDELVSYGEAVRITVDTHRRLPTHLYGIIDLSENGVDYNEQCEQYFRGFDESYTIIFEDDNQYHARKREDFELSKQTELPF